MFNSKMNLLNISIAEHTDPVAVMRSFAQLAGWPAAFHLAVGCCAVLLMLLAESKSVREEETEQVFPQQQQ